MQGLGRFLDAQPIHIAQHEDNPERLWQIRYGLLEKSDDLAAQARKDAFEGREPSDVQDIRDNIQDLGNSVGDLATRQYARAHDTVSDALRETGSAIQRNPLAAIGIGLGVGFLFGLVTGGRSKPNPVTSGA